MESSSPSPAVPSTGAKALASFYSNYLRSLFSGFLSDAGSSGFLAKISNLYRQATRARWRRLKPCLPLPNPSNSIDYSVLTKETSGIFDVFEDILEHLFANLHNVQKNLKFWQSKAEGSNSQRIYFFILERGPRAFITATLQLIHTVVSEASSVQQFSHCASAYIYERITILDGLRYSLATLLAQVYLEISRRGDDLVSDPQKALPSLLVTVNALFSNLEESIGELHASYQLGSSVGRRLSPLVFDKLPEAKEGQWTECEIRDALNLIHQNLEKLDSYLSIVVQWFQKPRKMAQYWVRYTCGTVGLSVCSLWLVRHSSLVGSPDIENWIREARETVINFWDEHVEQPILSIRDELFDTFRKRHKGVIDVEEVQLTANSLHRMLVAFAEQTKGETFPESASDQQMLEIVMARYEKELLHPIQNLLGGELARALLIQVQKLKLDIETAMLELDQILKANEINFAILAALPAFFLSLLLLMLVRSWIKQVSLCNES